MVMQDHKDEVMSPATTAGRARLTAAPRREIEPKNDLGDRWLRPQRDDAGEAAGGAALLQHSPREQADFDIAAWFALDDDENDAHNRCITECWYG